MAIIQCSYYVGDCGSVHTDVKHRLMVFHGNQSEIHVADLYSVYHELVCKTNYFNYLIKWGYDFF